jgi:hypothetical protein
MYQQEIKFFWPLTEQIPLDLDYKPSTDYIQQKMNGTTISSVNVSVGQTLAFSSGASPTWTTTVKADEMEAKIYRIVLDKKPNIVLRWVYKLLNINWKI